MNQGMVSDTVILSVLCSQPAPLPPNGQTFTDVAMCRPVQPFLCRGQPHFATCKTMQTSVLIHLSLVHWAGSRGLKLLDWFLSRTPIVSCVAFTFNPINHVCASEDKLQFRYGSESFTKWQQMWGVLTGHIHQHNKQEWALMRPFSLLLAVNEKLQMPQGHICLTDIYTSASSNGLIVFSAHIFRCKKMFSTCLFFSDLSALGSLHPTC